MPLNERSLSVKYFSSFCVFQLQERLKKCHNDYQKCHTKLMTEKCKYDDSVAKGKNIVVYIDPVDV